MATDDILQISDGTTTLDLLRGPVRLAQDGWAPGLSRLRDSELGNVPAWTDVDEELELEVVATAAQNPGQVWGQLQGLIQKARRWALGDPSATPPVTLTARPAGSRLAAGVSLASRVVGGDVPALHASFTRLLEGGAVPPARVTIRRRGAWLGASTSAQAGPATAQGVFTLTFAAGAPRALSPTSLAVNPTATITGTYPTLPVAGVILVGANDGRYLTGLRLIDLTAATGGGLSTVSGVARGGSFVRWTPPDTGARTFGPFNVVTDGVFDPLLIDVCTPYLTARASTRAFRVRLIFGGTFDDASAKVTTEWVTVQDATPRPYAFAPVASGYAHSTVSVEIEGGAVSGTFDLDTLALHIDQGPRSYAVRLAEGAFLVGPGSASRYNVCTILGDMVDFAAPSAGQYIPPTATSANSFNQNYLGRSMGFVGDAAVSTDTASVTVLPLICQGDSFLPVTASGSAQFYVLGRRYPAYLSLE